LQQQVKSFSMTLKVGITGGIGSGKSVVCDIFSLLGVPVFNSDAEARTILQSNEGVVAAVKTLFGSQAYDAQGMPDRKWIASVAFADPGKLKGLNALIHPAVEIRFKEWVQEHASAAYVLKEAAILVESGAYAHMDSVILVSAPEALRVSRACKRDKLSVEEVEKRSRNQMKESDLRKYAQHIILNDEVELLIPQVLKLHEILLATQPSAKT
jgi:dephospho-CoA kinase